MARCPIETKFYWHTCIIVRLYNMSSSGHCAHALRNATLSLILDARQGEGDYLAVMKDELVTGWRHT